MRNGKVHTRWAWLLASLWILACSSESKDSAGGDDDANREESARADDDAADDASDDTADDGKDDDDKAEPDAGKTSAKPDAATSGDKPASKPDAATGSMGGTPPKDAATPVQPSTPDGPDDGDPARPVVAIDGIPCRDPAGRVAFGRSNFMFDGRQMIVDYPCNKHEGAPMTFILNLHGTTPVEQHFYQWGYFSAWKHVASHNLIIVTPSSVVTQWGNGDNGVDQPHLLKTVDWVYETFGKKFDIRAMWVGGHSWGSFYTAQFGCLDAIKDKVKGLILMSGARKPACESRVSVLNTAANLGPDGMVRPEGLLNQAANATAHGCDAMMMRAVDMNNDETYWPNCDAGWVHANYLMKTKQHATSMDPSVVKSLVDYIKQARQ